MPKDTKTLGNNKARACESLGFVHKKRLCQRFDTTSLINKVKSKCCGIKGIFSFRDVLVEKVRLINEPDCAAYNLTPPQIKRAI